MKTLKASEEFVVGKHNIGYVSDFFLENYGTLVVNEGKPITGKTITSTMTDSEIIKQAGEVELGDILWLIDNQPDVLKETHWNVFPVKNFGGEVFLVSVCWGVGGRGWSVCMWHLTNEWGAGYQFFSRNWKLDTLSPDSLSLGDFESRIKALEEWRERVQQTGCPPHSLIDYQHSGGWAASVPPPNKICSKCLMTIRV
jgi:hypothetical protein